MCSQCEKAAVYVLQNGKKLCKRCFTRYYEKKVFETIRKFGLINKDDKIAIACSGGKDSTSLLYLINKFTSERNMTKPEALAIDEGIHGYRNKTLEELKEFCSKFDINLHIFSFKEEFGFSLQEALVKASRKKLGINSCYICGIFRKYLINKKARELGFTKLATGHNLDDEAQTILINQIKGNVALSAKLGPRTGLIEGNGKNGNGFVQRVKPLYMCTEKENMIYSVVNGIAPGFVECPLQQSYRFEVRDWLNNFEAKHPGAKRAIVNSFLELLPLLKERYKNEFLNGFENEKGNVKRKTIASIACKKCGEPSNREICKACELVKKLTESH